MGGTGQRKRVGCEAMRVHTSRSCGVGLSGLSAALDCNRNCYFAALTELAVAST